MTTTGKGRQPSRRGAARSAQTGGSTPLTGTARTADTTEDGVDPWLRYSSAAVVALSLLIVIGGGIVRLTGSGLGCSSWPNCSPGEFAPEYTAQNLHDMIEWTNRMLTGVLVAGVAVFIVVAWWRVGLRNRITLSGLAQLAIVLLNAVVGGISVLTGLNPWVVAGHFLAAMLLVGTAAASYELVLLEGRGRPAPTSRPLAGLLVVITGVVVVLGTAVSGSGPHSGDDNATNRMGFDWTAVTIVHGVAAAAMLVIALIYAAGISPAGRFREVRRRSQVFLGLVVLQGVVGIVQAMTNLPIVMVIVHLLMAAMLWAGAVRIYLAARFAGAAPTVGGPASSVGGPAGSVGGRASGAGRTAGHVGSAGPGTAEVGR